jgi:hypothetical protein
MKKGNPLFVDSTKFRGDLVATQIELKNILIYEDEALFVVVTTHLGAERRIQMKLLDDKSFEARLHLNHQSQISFQFVIEKQGRRLLQSIVHKGRAQYTISEAWIPVLEDPKIGTAETPVEVTHGAPAKIADEDAIAWARESSINVRSLIDKWGL